MKNSIPAALFNPVLALCGRRTACRPILPGEIHGVQTFAGAQVPSTKQTLSPTDGHLSLFFFVRGNGVVTVGEDSFAIAPWSLFIPAFQSGVTFLSDPASPLEFLEIVLQLAAEDGEDLKRKPSRLPYFIRYADCKTYKEAIKSEKTISRTLVPENIVPRFCMGSVETTGPDVVGAHKHPMLEQLFFGLAQNDCVVKADSTATAFGEWVLLHIPIGSEHGVRVDAGRRLHYLWLDFFKDKAGVEWISKMHTPN